MNKKLEFRIEEIYLTNKQIAELRSQVPKESLKLFDQKFGDGTSTGFLIRYLDISFDIDNEYFVEDIMFMVQFNYDGQLNNLSEAKIEEIFNKIVNPFAKITNVKILGDNRREIRKVEKTASENFNSEPIELISEDKKPSQFGE